MTKAEALAVVLERAGRWAENAEEFYPRRLTAEDTDEDLATLVAENAEYGDDVENLKEIRDVWLALKTLAEGEEDVATK